LSDQWRHQREGLESKLTAHKDTMKTFSTEKVELQEHMVLADLQQSQLQQEMSTLTWRMLRSL
jgi:hypothetical protein